MNGDKRPAAWDITPSRNFFEVTPANTDLAVLPKGLWIAEAGDLEIRSLSGVTVGPYAVVAGQIIPVSPAQVRTGTTATVIALA